MIVINNISDTKFSFNGVEYFKNFTPVVIGNKIRILNTYDSRIELTDYPTVYSDFELDGVVHGNVTDLQSNILSVIFNKEVKAIQQLTYQTLADFNAVNPVPEDGTPFIIANDSNEDNNGYWSVSGGVAVQNEGLLINEVEYANVSKGTSSKAVVDFDIKTNRRFMSQTNETNIRQTNALRNVKDIQLYGEFDINKSYRLDLLFYKTPSAAIDNTGLHVVITDNDTGSLVFNWSQNNVTAVNNEVMTISNNGYFVDLLFVEDVTAFNVAFPSQAIFTTLSEEVFTKKKKGIINRVSIDDNLEPFRESVLNKSSKVVFVGTSICRGVSAQAEAGNTWAIDFKNRLEILYPEVNFTFDNLAIGGKYLNQFLNDSFIAGTNFTQEEASRNAYSWKQDFIIGDSWNKHVELSEPDLLVVAFGMNTIHANQVYFTEEDYHNQLDDVVTLINSWDKTPTLVLYTEMLPNHTIIDGDGLERYKRIQKWARITREFAIRNKIPFLDVNRQWRIARDGEDETSIEYQRIRTNDLTILDGAGTVENDSFESNGVLLLINNIKSYNLFCTTSFTPLTNNSFALFRSRILDGDQTTGIQVIRFQDEIRYSENNVVIESVPVTALQAGVVEVITVNIEFERIRVYINNVLQYEREVSNIVQVGESLIGINGGGSMEDVQFDYGYFENVDSPNYTDDELVGTDAGFSTIQNFTTGGNGVNHPTRLALIKVFRKATNDFFNFIKL